ncbi:MAG: GntR family transcriptional regulator [Limnochordia bacterium]
MFKPAVRSNPTPLYYQVCTSIKKMILSGTYPVGCQLPTENQLVEMFKVSKITVRRGLELLAAEGIVERIPGKGTFVLRDDFEDERKVGLLLGFSEEMSQMGKKPGSLVLSAKTVKADDRLQQRLRVPKGADVFELTRLRTVNEVPYTIQMAYLPTQLFPGIADIDFANASLYDTLTHRYGREPHSASQSYTVVYADKKIARALDIGEGKPVFLSERLTFDREKTPIEYVRAFLRADDFALRLTLYRSENQE